MLLKDINIGFALTGSFYTFENTIFQIKKIVEEGANVIPIMSFNSYNINSKVSKAVNFKEQIESITKNKIINTIEEAEPIGPKQMTDIMVIAPCSRQYNCKIGEWNSGYTSTCRLKITFKK